jgi:hypothetical protein
LKRFLAHITLLFLLCQSGLAQKPKFYLGLDAIMDNREYYTPYGTHQTIFGMRVDPGVSFTFDSLHSVHLGINYMYEFGGELLGVTPQIDLYYSYQAEQFKMKFGSFPRRDVLDYPLILLTDTLNYYRPNIEGATVFYQWEWGEVHAWVDWTGRETPETRESILAGVDATFRTRIFYLTTIATRYHLAKTTSPDDSNQIRDDGSLVGILGANLSSLTTLDELDLSTGWVSTYLYARPEDFVWTGGWLSRLTARYKIFGVKGTYYIGDAPPLAYGDPLYRSGNYGRIDLFVDPFKNPRITSKIGWNLHFLPGDGLYHSQQILISIML